MSRNIGVTSRGIRGPIIRPGDDLVKIVVDTLTDVVKSDGIQLHDNDIIGITEAVVAKSQDNFASIDDIAADVRNKFGSEVRRGFSYNQQKQIFKYLKRNC